jgi:hypothetical protein
VQWLESFVFAEAMVAFGLASLNCRALLIYARGAHSAARRVGATAMTLVSAALALEALAFLAAPVLEMSPQLRSVGWLAVRSLLLLASGVISALLLRAGRARF